MGKLLVLVLVGVVFYLVWRGMARRARTRRGGGSGAEAERMVGCRQCGVHLPISEAVEADGNYFCSEEHRRLFIR
jgi:uncharacterized protein